MEFAKKIKRPKVAPKPQGYDMAPSVEGQSRGIESPDDGITRIHKDTKKERIENEKIKMLFR